MKEEFTRFDKYPDIEVLPKKFLYQGKITVPEENGRLPVTTCDICKRVSHILHIWTDGVKDINKLPRGVVVEEKGIGICPDCQQQLMNQGETDDGRDS